MSDVRLKTTPVTRFTASAAAAVFLLVASTGPARAQATAPDGGTLTLIDYFLPTPIVCPLTSNTWGAASVLPRDTCNGLEDSTNTQWNYWDGKILEGADGKFHIFAGRWPQNKGFADWPQSVIVEGVSNGTVIGSYIPTANAPWTYDNGKEQNVTGMALPNGSYALMESPGNLFTAASADGPWTMAGTISITANGSTISTQTTENMTIWPTAAGSFLIVSRSFQDMLAATSDLGPYVIQTTIPSLQSEGYEDPVIWCSGGQYHMVANMYNARKAYHFTSDDGIHNWKNMGLAYDPTSDFVRYTDGTVNHWYKAERPGVFLQNGHVTAFSFAVIDVDKTLDLANDTHGSKIIVVPFDGVSFDRDNPGPGSAGCPVEAGGAADAGGGVADAATVPADGGSPAQSTDAATAVNTGPLVDATAPERDAGGFDAAVASSATSNASSGGSSQSASTSTNGDAGESAAPPSSPGCSCETAGDRGADKALGMALFAGAALVAQRRRRRRVPAAAGPSRLAI
jgi:hypothetical protein